MHDFSLLLGFLGHYGDRPRLDRAASTPQSLLRSVHTRDVAAANDGLIRIVRESLLETREKGAMIAELSDP
jgi:hypothetical protein